MNTDTLIGHFRQFPTIFVCGILSVVVLAGIFVRGSGLSDSRDRLEQVSAEGARMDRNIQNAVELEEQLAAIREITGEVAARIVRPAELARNLQYFYRLESESGVTIRALDQRGVPAADPDDEEADDDAYVPVRYEIAVEGTYPDLLDFAYRIENGRHFSRFTQFEILRAQRTDSTTLQIAMNLELLGRR